MEIHFQIPRMVHHSHKIRSLPCKDDIPFARGLTWRPSWTTSECPVEHSCLAQKWTVPFDPHASNVEPPATKLHSVPKQSRKFFCLDVKHLEKGWGVISIQRNWHAAQKEVVFPSVSLVIHLQGVFRCRWSFGMARWPLTKEPMCAKHHYLFFLQTTTFISVKKHWNQWIQWERWPPCESHMFGVAFLKPVPKCSQCFFHQLFIPDTDQVFQPVILHEIANPIRQRNVWETILGRQVCFG